MTVAYIGTDHTRAALAVRERLALDGARRDAVYAALRADPLIAEAAILSTCNRTEIYVVAADAETALDRARTHWLNVTATAEPTVAGPLARGIGDAAVRHLFAVAASLESLVVGETQIGTQVREAFAEAAARQAAGPELRALARLAVTCAKRVRAETALGDADTSVSHAAVELAAQRLGGLRGRAALLIGAGRINEVSARLLREAGAAPLVVVSRTRAAAARLAAACGGDDAPLSELPALLARADLAIVATRATTPLVTPEAILPRPRRRPLLLCDIALPRNVDPAVGLLPGVELIDMETLRSVAPRAGARESMAAAWSIVEAQLERYRVEERTRLAVPLIARLRAHVDSHKDDELARTLASLEHLAPGDREAVALLAHRLVNRMFHHLASRLKLAATTPDAEAHLAALSFLFSADGTEYRTVTAPDAELSPAGDEPAAKVAWHEMAAKAAWDGAGAPKSEQHA